MDNEKRDEGDLTSDQAFRNKSVHRQNSFNKDNKLDYDIDEEIHCASEGQISPRNNSHDLINSLHDNKKREYSEGEIAKNHFVEMAKRNKYIKDTGKVQHLISTM